jgi:hypothetical protein
MHLGQLNDAVHVPSKYRGKKESHRSTVAEEAAFKTRPNYFQTVRALALTAVDQWRQPWDSFWSKERKIVNL